MGGFENEFELVFESCILYTIQLEDFIPFFLFSVCVQWQETRRYFGLYQALSTEASFSVS